MAMSKGVGVGSISIGCSLLVLTLISVICGGVVMGKMSSPAAVSIGLWAIYFLIPGVLSILAGYKRLSSLLAVALGTHVLGIILAIVGMSVGAAFWAILSSSCVGTNFRRFSYINDHCYCYYNDRVVDYPATCSDLETVRAATGAVTIIFALLAIVSFVGSIYGCIGTCCAPREPTVVVTTAQPNTVVMATTQAYPAYNQQPPPYGPPVGPSQVVFDSKP